MEHAFFNYSYWYRWRRLGLDPESPPTVECDSIQLVGESRSRVYIHAKITTSANGKLLFRQNISYIFSSDGTVKVRTFTHPTGLLRNAASLPRIGYSLCINNNLTGIIYLGRGPGENYPDRKAGSDLGMWSTSPKSMGYEYIVPCENGNRSDCSWALFRSETRPSDGFMIVAADDSSKEGFHFSALLHSQSELHRATHTHQLEDREEGEHPIYVNLDLDAMGIGGDVGWSPCVYEDYQLKPTKAYNSR